MSGDMYDWEHCDHRFIGEPGCPTCDPDTSRVMIRSLRLDNRDLRAQRDALAEALRWCEANWTKPAVDRGAGLPMIRAALAKLKEET